MLEKDMVGVFVPILLMLQIGFLLWYAFTLNKESKEYNQDIQDMISNKFKDPYITFLALYGLCGLNVIIDFYWESIALFFSSVLAGAMTILLSGIIFAVNEEYNEKNIKILYDLQLLACVSFALVVNQYIFTFCQMSHIFSAKEKSIVKGIASEGHTVKEEKETYTLFTPSLELFNFYAEKCVLRFSDQLSLI